MSKTKVWILIDWFAPGYKAGGPIRSVTNLVHALQDHCEFRILTTDTDYGESQPYPDVKTDEWTDWKGLAQVWYFSKDQLTRATLEKLLLSEPFDVLYLNSMFSKPFTLWPLRIQSKFKPGQKVILAPRGMLHPGALSIRKTKKMIFLRLLRLFGLHKNVTFHATDAEEIKHIREIFGVKTSVQLASNLPKQDQEGWEQIEKVPGKLKLVYVSRISLKKGPHLVLEWLADFAEEIEFDLYGPEEETEYAAKCRSLAKKLPSNVKVTFHGPVPPDKIRPALCKAHAFIMPTRGENFGHAIFEAFNAGRPVIISDQTPWRDLQSKKLGWDIPLADPGGFKNALRQLLAMDQAEFDAWSKASHAFAAGVAADAKILEKSITLFRR